MSAVCLCFQVHLPTRLLPRESIIAAGGLDFEDHEADDAVLNQLAATCYLSANRLFREAIEAGGGRFRIALSISGTVLDRLCRHRPDVLESFQDLVACGGVELLAAPWHHSLAFLHSNREFDRQVEVHLEAMEKLFHVRPRVFHNTDLIYNDAIAAKAETMGFDGVLAELDGQAPGAMPPNQVCRAPGTARIKTLPRHGGFSREFERDAAGHGLTESMDFAMRLAAGNGGLTLLFLRYEALAGLDGTNRANTHFWQSLPEAAQDAGLQWVTPSEAVDLYDARREHPCPKLTSWNDPSGKFTPWEGNALQYEVLERIHHMEKHVHAAQDAGILKTWAGLQASHYFHWMSSKAAPAMRHPDDACPYDDPADASGRIMAALDRIESRLAESGSASS